MVYELLKSGIENAVTSNELCSRLNISKDTLRQYIEKERNAGFPICSSTSKGKAGYFLATDRETMSNFCKHLRRRAISIFKLRKACRRMLLDLPAKDKSNEQVKLF